MSAAIREALEWYRDEAAAIADGRTNAVVAGMVLLALDGGRRAREALTMLADVPREMGVLALPSMDGKEIRPEVWLIGEPSPVQGSDKLRCLASVRGCLCVVELSIKFSPTIPSPPPAGGAQ